MIEKVLTLWSILFVLANLVTCASIWWMLASGEIETYRAAFRAAMRRKYACADCRRIEE